MCAGSDDGHAREQHPLGKPRLGALGAGLGVFAYLVGGLLTPISDAGLTTGEAVIPIVLIRGLFVLVALGVVLGLAYYGGMRVPVSNLAPRPPRTAHACREDAYPAALAGGLGAADMIVW